MFRSIRELLANAIKHGHPNSIVVGLQVTEGQYQVTVEDDGQGFDVNLVEEKAGTRGFGLFSIRERLDQLGGSVRIESRCNLGTRVVLSLPLDINEQ